MSDLQASSWVGDQKALTRCSAVQTVRLRVVQQEDNQRSPVAETLVAFRQMS